MTSLAGGRTLFNLTFIIMSYSTIMDWLVSKTAFLPTWARIVVTGVVGAGMAIAYAQGWIHIS